MENNNDLYEKFHEGTSYFKEFPREREFTLMNHIPIYKKYLKRTDVVLDIGCGSGIFSLWASRLVSGIKAVDLSVKAIAEAQKSKDYLKADNIEFLSENFMNYTDLSVYDVVMLTEVLEHLDDDKGALKKIYGLLKNNGFLLMSVPSLNAPLHKKYLKKYDGINPFDERVGHLRRYNKEIISNLLAECGFKINELKLCEGYLRNWLFNDKIGQKAMRFNRGFIKDMVKFIDEKVFLKLFGESDIIISAQKI
ncbi:MAG: class I SAM-dependent methyltransferase [Ignavibacteria bacterium]|nr:class I SAM-dependent methyltransferase [Ignavibacteria bacterium]